MPVTKSCPDCSCEVYIRKLVCPGCGHVLRKSKPLADNSKRRTLMRACAAKRRSAETAHQADERRRLDRECTARKRASETVDQVDERRKRDRVCTARKRASETINQADERRKRNRTHTALKRSTETTNETNERRKLDRERAATKRALETPAETDIRCKRRKVSRLAKQSIISIDSAITDFLARTKEGPDYVCVSCHRLMYRQTVIRLTRDKYKRASNSLLKLVLGEKFLYASFNSTYYICKTCYCALSRGSIYAYPVSSK